MTADLADIAARLRSALPKRWFSDNSPNLDAILRSLAAPWVWLHGLVNFAISQTRIATAEDIWLDAIAYDFFGNRLRRKGAESDLRYRARIKSALLPEAATRSAVSTGLAALVGKAPLIFEPANCLDTGSYGSLSQTSGSGLAYGQAGGWGSLELPLQFFVSVQRPATPGVSSLAGYGTPVGSYGEGTISYIDLSLLPGNITDHDIQSTLCGLLPVNAVAWLQII